MTHPCEDSSLDLAFFNFLGLLGPIWATAQLTSLQFASWSEARKAPLLPAQVQTNEKISLAFGVVKNMHLQK